MAAAEAQARLALDPAGAGAGSSDWGMRDPRYEGSHGAASGCACGHSNGYAGSSTRPWPQASYTGAMPLAGGGGSQPSRDPRTAADGYELGGYPAGYGRYGEAPGRYGVAEAGAGAAQDPMRDYMSRYGAAGGRDYAAATQPRASSGQCSGFAGEQRSSVRDGAYPGAPTDYVEVSEVPRDAAYNFPRDGSFVADAFREGVPSYAGAQSAYPSTQYPERGRSASPMPGRPASPMAEYPAAYAPSPYGAYASPYGGYSSYGLAEGYRGGCGSYSTYGQGGPAGGNAYDYGAGYARGGDPYGYAYGGGGGASYSRGDTYTGGAISYGPPPGRAPAPAAVAFGGYNGYGGASASSAPGGGASSAYCFPTAGSFVAEPFNPAAPPLSRPSSYTPPGSYGAGYGLDANAYGGCSPQYGGAMSPLPPSIPSFLGMPGGFDPAASFAAISGAGLGGGLGSCPSFAQTLGAGPAESSAAGAYGGLGTLGGFCGSTAPSASDAYGAAKLGAGKTSDVQGANSGGHGADASQTKPERPPYMPSAKAGPVTRSKKISKSRFGCC